MSAIDILEEMRSRELKKQFGLPEVSPVAGLQSWVGSLSGKCIKCGPITTSKFYHVFRGMPLRGQLCLRCYEALTRLKMNKEHLGNCTCFVCKVLPQYYQRYQYQQ